MLQVTAVPAFTDNYIWLIHSPRDPSQVVAVDPGEAAPVLAALSRSDWALCGILLTHKHHDHVGGVAELLDRFDVPAFAPRHDPTPAEPTKLGEGQHAEFAELGLRFDVLDVPGHTLGHIAYVGHGAVFSGDTLFSAGCGRLFEGTPEQMSESLAKFAALPPATQVYCGHEYTVSNLRFAQAVEPENTAVQAYLQSCLDLRATHKATLPSTIRQERNVNPFLRCHGESVKQAAERHAGCRLQNHVQVFATLRAWKDGFKS
ncbi:MAG TPA: hydroxyacylglutathione hydrolase [Steroidobacteraceae bacterium]|nr:hydroxyacylglutathione hydrolase [Steroidobacteraceae bacterium]